MLSSFWTAPAGVCGRGSVAVRPSLVAVVPVAQGSGLPFIGMAPRHDELVVRNRFGADQLQKTTTNDPITQNDGTTLGNHPSGRPRS